MVPGCAVLSRGSLPVRLGVACAKEVVTPSLPGPPPGERDIALGSNQAMGYALVPFRSVCRRQVAGGGGAGHGGCGAQGASAPCAEGSGQL